MNKITLRYLTANDEDQFCKSNNKEWGDFPFAHYWESLANKDYKKYVQITRRAKK